MPTRVQIQVFLEGALNTDILPYLSVRSEVRNAIAQKYPEQTTRQFVLLEGALALENALQAASSDNTDMAIAASHAFDHALECIEDDKEDALFILTITIDSYDRLEDYIGYNELLHGHVFANNRRATPCPGEIESPPVGLRPASIAPSKNTQVFYINGMWATRWNAKKHTQNIAKAYRHHGETSYRFNLLYNPTGLHDLLKLYTQANEETPQAIERFLRFMHDSEEIDADIIAQAMLSSLSKAANKTDEYVAVQNLFNSRINQALKEGDRVILIAHSQGNLFIDGIIQSIPGVYKESIGIIGIASTALTNTALVNSVYNEGYPYVTLNEDNVIKAFRDKHSSNILAANTDNAIAQPAGFNHFFGISYFKAGSQSREKIDEHMKAYTEGLVYPPPPLQIVDADDFYLMSGDRVSATIQARVVVQALNTQAAVTMTLKLNDGGTKVVSTPTEIIMLAASDDNIRRTATFTLQAINPGNTTMTISATDSLNNRDEAKVAVVVLTDGCKTCSEPAMEIVPAGTFKMGSPGTGFWAYQSASVFADREGRDRPQHDVDIQSFAVSKYEITRGQFSEFVAATGYDAGSCWNNTSFNQTDTHPVVCVSWNDLVVYLRWLSEQTGKQYRLLSEAEWEYAARAGTDTAYHFGNLPITPQQANYLNSGIRGTVEVGSYPANNFGLYDMLGNVYEWVADCGTSNYDNAPANGDAQFNCVISDNRVLRGGSYNHPTRFRLSSAYRDSDNKGNRRPDIGFRIACSLKPATFRITHSPQGTIKLFTGRSALATRQVQLIIDATNSDIPITITPKLDSGGESVVSYNRRIWPRSLRAAAGKNIRRTAEFTLRAANPGTTTMTVVVTDNIGASDELKFRVVVAPALRIIDSPQGTIKLFTGTGASATTQVQVVIDSANTRTPARITFKLDNGGESVVQVPKPIRLVASNGNVRRTTQFMLAAVNPGNTMVTMVINDNSGNTEEVKFRVVVAPALQIIDSPQAKTLNLLTGTGASATTRVQVVAEVFNTKAPLTITSTSAPESGGESVVSIPELITLAATDGNIRRTAQLMLAAANPGATTVTIVMTDNLGNTEEVKFRVVVTPALRIIDSPHGETLDLMSSGRIISATTQVQVVAEALNTKAAVTMTPVLDDVGASLLSVSEPITLAAVADNIRREAEFTLTAIGPAGDTMVTISVTDNLGNTEEVKFRVVVVSDIEIIDSPHGETLYLMSGNNRASSTTQVQIVAEAFNAEIPTTMTLKSDDNGIVSTTSNIITLTPQADDNTRRTAAFTLQAVNPGTTTVTVVVSDELNNRDEAKVTVVVLAGADCKTCPALEIVPAGTFKMGSPNNEPGRQEPGWNEGPRRNVSVRSFVVGKYEVTRGQYAEFVATTGYDDGDCKNNILFTQTDTHPAVCVSWRDAQAYIQWLSQKTGIRYRLLSEAEWEYAARAGTTTAYYFGNTITPKQANYNVPDRNVFSFNRTREVGRYPANSFGLHDMHGNVEEWVADCGNFTYVGAPTNGNAWLDDCLYPNRRIIRGGAFNNRNILLRSAYRDGRPLGEQKVYRGFRIARPLKTTIFRLVSAPQGTINLISGSGASAMTQVQAVIDVFDKEASVTMTLVLEDGGELVVSVPEPITLAATAGKTRRTADFMLQAVNPGNTVVTMVATDDIGNTVERKFRVVVAPALRIIDSPQGTINLISGSGALATTQVQVVAEARNTNSPVTMTMTLDSGGESVVSVPQPITLAANGGDLRRTAEFVLKAVNPGNTMVTIVVTDGLGNTKEKKFRVVVTPALRIIDSLQGTTLYLLSESKISSTTQVQVVAEARNTNSPVTMTMTLDSGGESVVSVSGPITLAATGGDLRRTAEFVLKAVNPGNTMVTIVATDGLGNTAEVKFRVVVASSLNIISAPQGTINLLSGTDTLSTAQLQVVVNAADPQSPVTMTLETDSGGESVVSVPQPIMLAATADDTRRTADFMLSAAAPGNTTVTIVISDASGNTEKAKFRVVVAPSLRISNVPQGTTLYLLSDGRISSTTEVQVAVEAFNTQSPVTMTPLLDDGGESVVSVPQPITLAATGGRIRRTADFMLSAVAPGNTTMTISVTDTLGNTAEAKIAVVVLGLGRACKTCLTPEMVLAPRGSFTMGGENEAAERPRHTVNIRAFEVGKYEITRKQFEVFVNVTGYESGRCRDDVTYDWRNPGFEQTDTHPVVCVSWHDAQAYIQWLAMETGRRYRLLSEAEWEYAARAGTTSRFNFGGTSPVRNRLHFRGGGRGTVEVGRYPANSFGLHDAHGNVYEWVADCWHNNYRGAPTNGDAWLMNCVGTDQRVLRGGGWNSLFAELFSYTRTRENAAARDHEYGFRIARTIPLQIMNPLNGETVKLFSGNGALATAQLRVVTEELNTKVPVTVTLQLDDGDKVVSIPTNTMTLAPSADNIQRTAEFTLQAVNPGNARLTVVATDSLGNRYEVKLSVVVVPQLQVVKPPTFYLLSGDRASATRQARVDVQAFNTNISAAVTLKLDSGGNKVVSIPANTITLAPPADDNIRRTAEFTLRAVNPGNTTMTISVTDNLNNRAETKVAVVVLADDGCKTCLEPAMEIAPAGTFTMGSPASELGRNPSWEEPQRDVTVRSFIVSKYEVTRSQFAMFVDAEEYKAGNKCAPIEGEANWLKPGFTQTDTHPVVCISWRDAQAYIKWLSQQTGERYRLLSEAEWEYVARAGTTTAYHFGADITQEQAHYNSSSTVVVGSYPANNFGLHDMHGNASELVADCFHYGYQGAPNTGDVWTDDCDNSDTYTRRGGSWQGDKGLLRSAARVNIYELRHLNWVGFRIARDIVP